MSFDTSYQNTGLLQRANGASPRAEPPPEDSALPSRARRPGTQTNVTTLDPESPSAPNGEREQGHNPAPLQRVIRVAASITRRLLILAVAPVPTPEIDFRSRSGQKF